MVRRTNTTTAAPEYKRASDLRKWYEKATNEISRVLSGLPEVYRWENTRRYW
jgi:hypothetical protein